MTSLTILTPSIPEHDVQRTMLSIYMDKQIQHFAEFHSSLGVVLHEVYHTESFLNGGLSIGKKREFMVSEVATEYCCFLDADDMPSPNYVEQLMRLCNRGDDVVTFRSFVQNDYYWTLVDMALYHTQDEQANPERIVKRKPWLVCPVRTEYAKAFLFPNTNYSEDSIWMNQVLTLCKTESHTDQILHSYRHSSKTSESDRIMASEANKAN